MTTELRRPGLRERNRIRNRAAILDAACDLFVERGYHATTITDIAAAAGIAPRTFFGYFPTKQSLLFPESQARIEDTVAAVLGGPAESRGPLDALLRALDLALAQSDDMTSRLAEIRTQLLRDEPELGEIGARYQYQAAHRIAQTLMRAYPALSPVEAGALAGAFVGAAGGAVYAVLGNSDRPAGRDPAAMIRAAVAAVLSEPGRNLEGQGSYSSGSRREGPPT